MKLNNFLNNDRAFKLLFIVIISALFISAFASITFFALAKSLNVVINLSLLVSFVLALFAVGYNLLSYKQLGDNTYLAAALFLLLSSFSVTGLVTDNIAVVERFYSGSLAVFSNLSAHGLQSIALISLIWLVYFFFTTSANTNQNYANKAAIKLTAQLKIALSLSALLFMLAVTSFVNDQQSVESAGYSLSALTSVTAISHALCLLALMLFIVKQGGLLTSAFVSASLFSLFIMLIADVLLFSEILPASTHAIIRISLFVLTTVLLTYALAQRINQQSKQKIDNLRYHQATGLPSKILLEEQLTELIKHGKRKFSLLILQPDCINDIKKYLSEEALIQAIAKLSEQLRTRVHSIQLITTLTDKHEKIAFLDGNCFAFIVNTAHEEKLLPIVEVLQNEIKTSFTINKLNSKVSGVIGIAQFPEHSRNAKNMNTCSLIALKQAYLNKNKWSYYQQDLSSSSNNSHADLSLALELQQAIANDELAIYHQPQLDLKMLRVCGSECLLRWQHSQKGLITPETIIPLAEDLGLMTELTLWVVKTSLKQHKEICEAGNYNHMVSINISPKDVLNKEFLGKLFDIIEKSEVSGDKIILELNNSATIINNPDALEVMAQLSEIGITVSVDDFYSGYTTLANYKTLPFQELKISGQFVSELSGSARQKSITETTIKMAKSLSLEVVAEGINNQWEQDVLSKFGCDIGQGHLYSHAVHMDEYIKWLAAQTNGKAPESLYGEFIPAKNKK